MADTHDLPGDLFWHLIRVRKDTPLHHRASTQEVDYPYRRSDSHVVRIWPLPYAVVAGRWVHSDFSEDEALLAALDGRADAVGVVDDEGHIVDRFERADCA